MGSKPVERQPPQLGADWIRLFARASAGFVLDEQGRLSAEDQRAEALLVARARRVGAALTALLPAPCFAAIARLASPGAGPSVGIVRVRVSGPCANEALLLPWELLLVDDNFPVAAGRFHLVREVVVPSAEGFPAAPPLLSVVAHISCPEGQGIPELDLENAAYRMARALDPLRERTRFTELGSLEDLESAARAVRPALIHFSGHGLPGHLLFEDDVGGPDPVPVVKLLRRLVQAMGRLPLAIWLSCCYGAGDLPQGLEDLDSALGRSGAAAFAAAESRSVAADLHRAGVPQILGYFGPVPDDLAVVVDRCLFESLVETGSTLEATRRARLAMKEIRSPGGLKRYPLAWILLGLFHRGPDRLLLPPAVTGSRGSALPLQPETLRLEGVEALRHGFIGRRRLLAELRRAHRQGERVLGLYGLGGLGKTATCTRLASLLRGGSPGWEEAVIAIPASELAAASGEALRAPLFPKLRDRIHRAVTRHPRRPPDWDARLAALDSFESAEERGVALARALLHATGDGILYVDNAETLQAPPEEMDAELVAWIEPAVAAFFGTLTAGEEGSATVLLTTRYRPAGNSGLWLEIPPSSTHEIFRLLSWLPTLSRLPLPIREHLAEDRLAGHPRAARWVDGLVQEAESRWIAAGHLPIGLWESEEILEREVVEPALAGLPRKIDQDLALTSLLASLPVAARSLLGEARTLALPVPFDLIQELGVGAEVLRGRGLLTRFSSGVDVWAPHPFVCSAAAVHPAVPGWTREGRARIGRYWDAHSRATDSPTELREALEHLAAGEVWEEAARVTVRLSQLYRTIGWPRARLDLLEGLAATAWPKPQRSSWTFQLGDAREDMGDLHGAEAAMRESLALDEAIFGSRLNKSSAFSLSGLASVLGGLGRYGEAEVAFRESLQIFETVAGTRKTAGVATVLHGLGTILHSLGRYREAEAAYRESLVIEDGLQRRRPLDLAPTLAALARTVCELGRYPEAEDLFQRALRMLRSGYPDGHGDIAATLHGLSTLLMRAERYGEAESAVREAIAIETAIFGTREHPAVATSLQGLADILSRPGQLTEAEQAFREALRIHRAIYREADHAEVGITLYGLGNVLDMSGRFDEAEATYREAIRVLRSVLGAAPRAAVGVVLVGLGGALLHQQRQQEAEATFREAIAVLQSALETSEHLDIAAAHAGLAFTLEPLERYDEAEASSHEALRIVESIAGSRQHSVVAACLRVLGSIAGMRGRSGEAMEFLEESLQIGEKVYGSRRALPNLPVLELAASVLMLEKRYPEALTYARDAWEGAMTADSDLPAVSVGTALIALLLENGLREEAGPILRHLGERIQKLPKGHPFRKQALEILGRDEDTLPEP